MNYALRMMKLEKTDEYQDWFTSLPDKLVKARIEARRATSRRILMAKTKTTPYDTADYLKTEEDRALYFDACLDEAGDDPAFIAKALGDIARARGMTQLAQDTGLAREGLYRALSGQGNPEFATILKVINALGLRLHAGVSSATSV